MPCSCSLKGSVAWFLFSEGLYKGIHVCGKAVTVWVEITFHLPDLLHEEG